MRIQMHFSGMDKESLGDHDYERIVTAPLRRFTSRLQQVSLYLEDVNGPRGGIDKHCRCVLHLRKMRPIIITDQDDCASALLHRVIGRAAYTLSRKAGRRISRRVRAGSSVQRPVLQPG